MLTLNSAHANKPKAQKVSDLPDRTLTKEELYRENGDPNELGCRIGRDLVAWALDRWKQIMISRGIDLSERRILAAQDLIQQMFSLMRGHTQGHFINGSCCGFGKTTFVEAVGVALTDHQALFNGARWDGALLYAAEQVKDLQELYRALKAKGVSCAMLHSKRGSDSPTDINGEVIHSAAPEELRNALVVMVTHQFLKSRKHDPDRDFNRYGVFNGGFADRRATWESYTRTVVWDEKFALASTYIPVLSSTVSTKTISDHVRAAVNRIAALQVSSSDFKTKILQNADLPEAKNFLEESLKILDRALTLKDGEEIQIPVSTLEPWAFAAVMKDDSEGNVYGGNLSKLHERAGQTARVLWVNAVPHLFFSSRAVHPMLKNMLILDASVSVDPLVEITKTPYKKGYQANYSQVHLHPINKASSKVALKSNRDRDNHFNRLKLILDKHRTEESVVVVNKENRSWLADKIKRYMQDEIAADNRPAQGADVHLLTWGQHRGSNAYKTCRVTILAQGHYLPDAPVRGSRFTASGFFTEDAAGMDFFSRVSANREWRQAKNGVLKLKKRLYLDYVLQAAARGNMRNITGDKAGEQHVYVIDKTADWICSELKSTVWPEATLVEPARGRTPKMILKTDLVQRACLELTQSLKSGDKLTCRAIIAKMREIDNDGHVTPDGRMKWYSMSAEDFQSIEVPGGRLQRSICSSGRASQSYIYVQCSDGAEGQEPPTFHADLPIKPLE
jgi:hypothetical protein